MMFEQAKQRFIEGNAHFEAGRYEDAERSFEASLGLLPGRASTMANLAATRLRLNRPTDALTLLDQVLTTEPDDAEARMHRATALAALGRSADALADAERVTVLQPDSGEAWHLRAMLATELHRHADALQAFKRLTLIEPQRASAWANQAQSLQRLDRLDEALAAFDRALALDATLAGAWSQRGSILKELGRADEAVASFRHAMQHGGDAQLTGYFLSALGAGDMPDNAPRSYVEALFDNYAPGFDAHLVGVLGYDAHRVLTEPLVRLATHVDATLDLGCGTGLCGPLLRPMTTRLVGVDLSQGMLDEAARLSVYDRLVHADIVDHLTHADERHDLIVAADVFIYVGRLEAVFAGARRVLAPGGRLCFSIELAADPVDVRITEGLRYAHSERYLRSLAAMHRFEWVQANHHPIRQEQRRPIDGLFVYLRAV